MTESLVTSVDDLADGESDEDEGDDDGDGVGGWRVAIAFVLRVVAKFILAVAKCGTNFIVCRLSETTPSPVWAFNAFTLKNRIL